MRHAWRQRPSGRSSTAAATQSAATTAAPTGRVSPASAANSPAHSHRRVSAAWTPQAASAVKSDSEYAIDWTIPTGSTPHSTASVRPTRRPYSRSPIAKIPQAANRDVTQLTSRPASAASSGAMADITRSSAGSRGKNARLEWTAPSGRWTVWPYPSSAMRAYHSESQRAERSWCALLSAKAPQIARTTSPSRRVPA